MIKRPFGLAACLGGVALGWGAVAAAQALPYQQPELPKPELRKLPGSSLTVYPVRGGVYMVTGAGANVTVSVGRNGVLVVDPGGAASAKQVLAEIQRLSDLPVRYVLLTTGDLDHSGAAAAVAAAGEVLGGGNARAGGEAPIWGHNQVQTHMVDENAEGAPTETYIFDQKEMFVNGEPVQMIHTPGHTDGDSFVVFRRSDVVSAGDIYTPDRYPVIDLKHGGSIDQLIAGLNALLRLTVPEFNQEGGTFVIPGHGRLSDEADVNDYRDMVTIVRDRVRDMIRRKLTLAQVQAARPTLDYDTRYGADKGAVFVEQVYRSLTAPPKPAKEDGQ